MVFITIVHRHLVGIFLLFFSNHRTSKSKFMIYLDTISTLQSSINSRHQRSLPRKVIFVSSNVRTNLPETSKKPLKIGLNAPKGISGAFAVSFSKKYVKR